MPKKKCWRTKKLKVELSPVEGLSEEEIERRWNRICEILEDEIRRRES